jgi:hypothetical protein
MRRLFVSSPQASALAWLQTSARVPPKRGYPHAPGILYAFSPKPTSTVNSRLLLETST